MEDPPKRKRGRPRKTPPPAPAAEPPEEIIIQAPEPEAAPEEEVIHLSGGGEPEAEAPPDERAAEPPTAPEAQHETAVAYVPQPPQDDAKERARRHAALTKVKRYRESFPAVRAMPFSEEWSTVAIESHLEDIRITVSSRTTGLIVKSAYVAGVKGLEVGTCMVGMKTYGLADLVARNAEIDSILKEVQAELGIGTIPPMQRLALATMSVCFVLDSSNRKAEAMAGFKKEPVNVQLRTKYGDL